MSRIGKKPIPVPPGVKIAVTENSVRVEGPKGKLEVPVPARIRIEVKDGTVLAHRDNDEKAVRALHGLTRALIANAVHGVTSGFSKELDVVGIGYRAEMRGKYLNLSLGFSHPIEFPVPPEISIKVERFPRTIQNYVTSVVVSGADRERVGQVAADIRALRPPDPYRGKGIRYANETIRLKVGKKGA
ncbi:MAG TPA: 50S ribosomal protein L6 [Acidobacteriota bacterium]|nr:50S ribosomal protein L6 [Acidobacteriota bacterium]